MPKFVPRQRKQRHRRGVVVDGFAESPPPDTNVVQLLPRSKAERESKRQRLQEELRAQHPKISTKKQKSNQDNKLKKAEASELLKNLAQAKVDTSLFRSSKTLGVNRETRRDILLRSLNIHSARLKPEGHWKVPSEECLVQQPDAEGKETTRDEGSSSPDSATQDDGRHLEPFSGGMKRRLDVDGDQSSAVKRKRKRVEAIHTDSDAARYSQDGSASSSEHAQFSSMDERGKPEASSISSSKEGDPLADSDSLAESSSNGHEVGNEKNVSKQRFSAFKVWADQRRTEALEIQDTASSSISVTPVLAHIPAPSLQPREPDHDPLPPELEIKRSDRKAFSVHVERDPQTLANRLALPVVAEEQRIMEAIHGNSVVMVCGATGSGKTTQIPQFFFEAGYGNPESQNPGMIGITQPRRVAAVTMARRVSGELGRDGGKVAYKIRFESSVRDTTAIKFMTDGILLREVSEDITLRKYSAIIIDEAHERSINTDLLIGMMSRIVRLRESLSTEDTNVKPLKLIIMSATLAVADFICNKDLYPVPPPIVQVEGRQYPVTVHWARKTSRDYLDEAYRKICKGHKTLPPGGMLVFLTGQDEINQLLRKLKQTFPLIGSDKGGAGLVVRISGTEAPIETEDVELGSFQDCLSESDFESSASVDDDIIPGKVEDDLHLGDDIEKASPMHVLPLYSLLPTSEQLRVFDPPPQGSRLVILSTNIAETSLTIPDIRYVFDCGRAKERRYNTDTSVQSFKVGWISKASANQRTGRAGRTGPGHCYRLYSSAVYERDFEEHAQPEILRVPLEGVVLQLLRLGVPKILDKFPFPTLPGVQRLRKTESLLEFLGALSKSGQLTELGCKMSTLPISPRLSKILLAGQGHACLPYTIALVAALSVPETFLSPNHISGSIKAAPANAGFLSNAQRLEEDAKNLRIKAYNNTQWQFSQLGGTSDVIKLLAAVLAHVEARNHEAFCEEHFLRPKAMREIQLLRRQLGHLLGADPLLKGMIPPDEEILPRPSEKQVKYLKQIAASGFVDQIAIRADLAPSPPEQPRKPKRATNVPYLPLFPSAFHREKEKTIYIHPSSVLAHLAVKDVPQYIVYLSLQQSADSSKIRMLPLTPVSASQLAALTSGTPLQSYSKPIKEAVVNMPDGVTKESWVIPTLRGAAGSQGWPLPAKRIVQRKVDGVWI